MNCHAFLPVLVISLCIPPCTSLSQEWYWQNPLPQGNLLSKVKMLDHNTAIAIGFGGTIGKTTNAGATWEFQHDISGPTNLYGEFFTDDSTGVVVGENGTVLRTTDGGITWSTRPSQTGQTLHSVFFTDANSGTAVGDMGVIRRTTDGGVSWMVGTSISQFFSLLSVSFANPDTGFIGALGEFGGIWFWTTDGGTTWVENRKTYYGIYSISFADANTGIAVDLPPFYVPT